jgi:hypothetical protein
MDAVYTDGYAGSIDTTGWIRLPNSSETFATFYKVAGVEPPSHPFVVDAGFSAGFRNTTLSKHREPLTPNLVARQFEVTAPNQVGVTDLTYLPTRS